MSKDSGLVSGTKGPRPYIRPQFSKEEHKRCLSEGKDVPELLPDFRIDIDEVGISQKTVWINLPEGRMPFDAEITTDLPGDFKGIHMSRIENQISLLNERSFSDIREYGLCLSRGVLAGQRGRRVKVILRGLFPISSITSISKRISIDNIEIYAKAESKRQDKDEISQFSWLGLGVFHITACPCTQVYNETLFSQRASFPMPTHSQRCKTWVYVEDMENRLAFDDILEPLLTSLHVISDLLKRPDEAELVFRSHKVPQFAEDVVRNVAKALGEALFDRIPRDSRIRIETLSLESIHIHNVKCRLNTRLKDIIDAL